MWKQSVFNPAVRGEHHSTWPPLLIKATEPWASAPLTSDEWGTQFFLLPLNELEHSGCTCLKYSPSPQPFHLEVGLALTVCHMRVDHRT